MGICNCTSRIDEGKVYLEFMESLKINTIKSEDLIKKLKEKYLTITNEDKKKSALLNIIFPMIDSSVIEYREFSQNYFDEYFVENKKNFYALALFCDKESNFKRSFEEITNANKKAWGQNYSSDKSMINKEFLWGIMSDYLKFSTVNTISYMEKINGSKITTKYLTDLFDEETRSTIVKDLFQSFNETGDMVNVDLFFRSDCFKKIINRAEILKSFETYDSLKNKS